MTCPTWREEDDKLKKIYNETKVIKQTFVSEDVYRLDRKIMVRREVLAGIPSLVQFRSFL